MPKDNEPTLLKLITSLIIPFDIKPVKEYLSQIRDEAAEASWSKVFRSFANIGLIISTIGLLGVMGFLVLERGAPNISLPDFGIFTHFIYGAGVFALLVITKLAIKVGKYIEEGISPVSHRSKPPLVIVIFELAFGGALIAIIVYYVGFSLPIPLIESLFILSFSSMIIGITLTGMSLFSGGLYDIVEEIKGRQESENYTLDEFPESEIEEESEKEPS